VRMAKKHGQASRRVLSISVRASALARKPMRVPLDSVSATFGEGTRAKEEPPISIHSDDRLDTLRFMVRVKVWGRGTVR